MKFKKLFLFVAFVTAGCFQKNLNAGGFGASRFIPNNTNQSQKNFSRIDFGNNRNYHNIIFINSNFSNSRLQTRFSSLDISWSNFTKTTFYYASLNEWQAMYATFQEAIFEGTSIKNSTFVECSFSDITIMPTYFLEEQTCLNNCSFRKCNFSSSSLSTSSFLGCDLTRSFFPNAEAQEVIFENVLLEKTNWQNANLFGSKFTNATLEEADFRGANLSQTNFVNSNLSHVKFDNNTQCEDMTIDNATLDTLDPAFLHHLAINRAGLAAESDNEN